MPKRDSDLAKLATVIWDVVKQRAKASNQHVYSHNLDPWNTLADNVAKAAALGTVHDSVLPDLWVEGLAHVHQRVWDWIEPTHSDRHASPPL
eukprot:9338552-Pyramimonas_sp.AAC.1